MEARQLSSRGGELSVELASGDQGDRVIISGRTAFYMEGTIHLQEPEGTAQLQEPAGIVQEG